MDPKEPKILSTFILCTGLNFFVEDQHHNVLVSIISTDLQIQKKFLL